MDLIKRYQQLPDAHSIPDEVWAVQKCLNRIDRLQADIADEKTELERLTPHMMRVLRVDWTDKELRIVGLLT